MSIVLGGNNYGKAETHLVRVVRDSPEHELVDITVSTALSGDLSATHLVGDNADVLPTDTQKNTVFAFAREYGIGEIEAFGLRLARHFVSTQPAIHQARISITAQGWRRLGPHSFVRSGEGVRTAVVTDDGAQATVVSGVDELVLMNTTDSRFEGFPRDRYTTLAEASDRILATAVRAQWRHASANSSWDASYEGARQAMVNAFVSTYSHSLQQTLYAMGRAVLDTRPEIVEVRLSLPNKHHFLVDLSPFGLENPGEVFYAADRPYGLIEGTVLREGATPTLT